jgi:HSP20 family protein
MLAPFAQLRRDLDRLWQQANDNGWAASMWEDDGGSVRIDVAETDKEIQVIADIPGIDPKDVDITLANNVLTIRGEKKSERDEKKADFHLVERRFGAFTRKIAVPQGCDHAQVKAEYANGVLTIRVPKPAEAVAANHKIKITKT